MQVGCGIYLHTVRERAYLYFWHYETRDGSRVQMKEYVGPANTARTIAEAVRRCDAYYARAADELRRLRESSFAMIREFR